MAHRRLVSAACLVLTGGLTLLSFLAPTIHAQAPQRAMIDGVPDTGQFLPDTAILARVNDRVIRVSHFNRSYFASWPPERPAADSAGRVEFLNALIDKEVMSFLAQEINPPLDFADRLTLREHTQLVLTNVLYQRAVLDSVVVSEADLRRAYEQSGYEQRLRRIVFDDRPHAERVRRDIVAGRIRWPEAFARSSRAAQDSATGDLGWVKRSDLDPVFASRVGELSPGATSPVIESKDGYALFQVVARRPVSQMPFEVLRRLLQIQLRTEQIAARTQRLRREWLKQVEVAHDSANIAWAAARFSGKSALSAGPSELVIDLAETIPDIAPEDMGRVLARFPGGALTLGQFVDRFRQIDVVLRPPVNRPFLLRDQIDAFVLEPYMARLATERGLANDSLAVAMIEQKRLQILVEHIHRDSVESRIRVLPEDRKKYYESHLPLYFTYPAVRYAWIVRNTRAEADSLARLLQAGTRAEDVVRADSLKGLRSSFIRTRTKDEEPLYKEELFEEMKPGEIRVKGPDPQGAFLVLQLLSRDPGHQLSFAESETYVDQAARGVAADTQLHEFLARHRRRFRIHAHPELVMKIRFVDPTL